MNDIWYQFFNDPRLKSIIEEAQAVDSDDDPEIAQGEDTETGEGEPQAPAQGDEGGQDIEQLTADFQQGNISQDELIQMYQQGQISKDDIQQIIQAAEGAEEPQSEEELLAQQIDQTNDMFIKFSLYDKVADLTEKLNHFKENFDDLQSDIYDRVLQLREFLNILSSLIFNIETPVAYQMYGSILLQLTELFTEYNKEQQQEEAEDQREDAMEDAQQKKMFEMGASKVKAKAPEEIPAQGMEDDV
jgi:hypothetical protein